MCLTIQTVFIIFRNNCTATLAARWGSVLIGSQWLLTAASKPYISKCNTKCWMQWCKARCHWTPEQWRRVLWGDKSLFSIWWTSLGLEVARRKVPVWLHCAKCKIWWRGIMVWGCFSGAGLGSLVPVKGTLNSSTYQEMLDNSWSQLCGNNFGMVPSCSNMTVHQCAKQGP